MDESVSTSAVDDLRQTYQLRAESGKDALYHWSRPEVLFSVYRLRAEVQGVLNSQGFSDLANVEILDFGCGKGEWLRSFLDWGARAENLHGVDLISNRIEEARAVAPQIDFHHVEGGPLNFEDGKFSLLFANTVFSSVLEPDDRRKIADEMIRVLDPKGAIFIYDFRVRHPANPQTTAITNREIRRLFPEHEITQARFGLAPPLLRKIARFSVLSCYLLERMAPFLTTHSLFVVRGKESH